MLDPLTSLSLAANILTFIEFASKLVATSKEIYSKGTSLDSAHLESIAQALSGLTDDIQKPIEELDIPRAEGNQQRDSDGDPVDEDRAKLDTLAHTCREIAVELSEALRTIRPKLAEGKKWKSFYHALCGIWNNGKVEKIHSKLQDLRAALSDKVIVIIW